MEVLGTYENRQLFKPFGGHMTKLRLPKKDKLFKISRNFFKIPEKFWRLMSSHGVSIVITIETNLDVLKISRHPS